MTYADLLTSTGNVNTSVLMRMAHAHAKQELASSRALQARGIIPAHIELTYADAFQTALRYLWQSVRSAQLRYNLQNGISVPMTAIEPIGNPITTGVRVSIF